MRIHGAPMILRSKVKESLTFECVAYKLRHKNYSLLLGFSVSHVVHVVLAGGLSPCPNWM